MADENNTWSNDLEVDSRKSCLTRPLQEPRCASKPGETFDTWSSDLKVAERFGVSRQTIWRWVKEDPTFPCPIKLSPGCTRFRDREITEWVGAKMAEREREPLTT